MTRPEILEAARKCVCGEREKEYGPPERNFGVIATFWNDYLQLDIPLTAADVAIMMALFKIGRIRTGTATKDSFIDLAGYAACAGEICTEAWAEGKK